MKTPDDNDLDRLFREGLNNPDRNAAFREEDWEAMEGLLDEKPRKDRGIIWLYRLSGSIAAMLILFFGWELMKPVELVKNNIAKVSIPKKASTESNKSNADKVDLLGENLKSSSGNATKSTELAVSKKKIYADKNSIKKNNNQVDHANTGTDKILLASGNKSNIINSRNNTKRIFSQQQNNNGTNNLAVNEASQVQKQTMVLADEQANVDSEFYGDKSSIDLEATELTASQAKNVFTDNTLHFAVTPTVTNLLANRKVIAKTNN